MGPRRRRQKATAAVAELDGGAIPTAPSGEQQEDVPAAGFAAQEVPLAAAPRLPADVLLEIASPLKPTSRTLCRFALASRETDMVLVPLVLSTVVLERVLTWTRFPAVDPEETLRRLRNFLGDALDLGRFDLVKRIDCGSELFAKCRYAAAVSTASLPAFVVPILASLPALEEVKESRGADPDALAEIRKHSWPLRRLSTYDAETAIAFTAVQPSPDAVMDLGYSFPAVPRFRQPGDVVGPSIKQVLAIPCLRSLRLSFGSLEERERLPKLDHDLPNLSRLEADGHRDFDPRVINENVSRAPNLEGIVIFLQWCYPPERIMELSEAAVSKIDALHDADLLLHVEILLRRPEFNPRVIGNDMYEVMRKMDPEEEYKDTVEKCLRRAAAIWPELCRRDGLEEASFHHFPTRALLGGIRDRPPPDVAPRIRSRAMREEIDFWRAGTANEGNQDYAIALGDKFFPPINSDKDDD
ncbi:hypothetical protein DFJ74DRAFT_769876, partial [Hyaloraphidium curvatum]